MTEGKRVAIYARVSTAEQTTENQLLDLRSYCAARGWKVVETFDDPAFSGKTKNRPALDKLMAFVRAGRCDCVLVWGYDRFARSLPHLVNALEEFRERGVDFASLKQGIDTSTSHGRAFFGFIAVMAEFERELICERIHSGLRRARSQGKRFGRPGIPESEIARILAERGKGSTRQIATRLSLSKSVVHRVLSQKGIQNVASIIDGIPVAR